jgi:RNA-directed DNA polymerase
VGLSPPTWLVGLSPPTWLVGLSPPTWLVGLSPPTWFLSPTKRWELAKHICIDGQSHKVKRVWIPKANSTELRPLGIPTIKDRAKQALAMLALEPEWEAKFEANTYGFRPGRGAHDAIEAIHSCINKKPKYVLDADIRKCFDRINHEFLLSKLNTYPNMQRQIKAWLKAV